MAIDTSSDARVRLTARLSIGRDDRGRVIGFRLSIDDAKNSAELAAAQWFDLSVHGDGLESSSPCSSEIADVLREESLPKSTRFFYCHASGVAPERRGSGLGKWLYAESARVAWALARSGVMQDYCRDGYTSNMAARAWASSYVSRYVSFGWYLPETEDEDNDGDHRRLDMRRAGVWSRRRKAAMSDPPESPRGFEISTDYDLSTSRPPTRLRRRRNGPSRVAPDAVRSRLREGLRLKSQGRGGKGLVDDTVSEARGMASGKVVSDDKVRRMVGWFRRHQVDRRPGWEQRQTPGWVAWLLWGGDEGWAWAERERAELVRRGVLPPLASAAGRKQRLRRRKNPAADPRGVRFSERRNLMETVITARVGRRIAGTATWHRVNRQPTLAHLEIVHVRAGFERRGFGAMLVAAARRSMMASGAKAIDTDVTWLGALAMDERVLGAPYSIGNAVRDFTKEEVAAYLPDVSPMRNGVIDTGTYLSAYFDLVSQGDAAGVFLVARSTGRALFILRSKDRGDAGGLWSIPAGRVDPGEDPSVAAAREADEEVGVLVKPEHLLPIGVTRTPSGGRFFVFFAIIPAEPRRLFLAPKEVTEARFLAYGDQVPGPLHPGMEDLASQDTTRRALHEAWSSIAG